MKTSLIVVLCAAFILTTVPGWAVEGLDENEIFSEGDTVVAVEKKQDEKLMDVVNLDILPCRDMKNSVAVFFA